ncbi:MAG TPA: methyltransferase domain-containing protein [Xanthobacteraceae bacterium]|nr:methyltransferase domain-containing protein [Xanthobacteraceae bacterium]
MAFGIPPRFDARCPRCGSMERHRLEALWISENREKLDGKVILHFAPEEVIARLLKPHAAEYIDGDKDARRAGMALDLERINLEDESVDVVICNHVLEHVDDRRALSEICRILRRNGLAIFTFPVVEGWDCTYEDPSITDKRLRTLHFGQYDHLRWYGRDVRQRIISAGLEIEEFTAKEPEVSRLSLTRGEKVFLLRRAS